MKYANNILGRAGTIVAALAMTASLSMAGDMRFDLPFDAVWNGIHLSPGPYTLTRAVRLGDMPILQLYGNGKSAFITMPAPNARKYTGTKSQLRVVTAGGVRYITDFENAATNSTQHFSVPKTTTMELARDRRPTTSVALALK